MLAFAPAVSGAACRRRETNEMATMVIDFVGHLYFSRFSKSGLPSQNFVGQPKDLCNTIKERPEANGGRSKRRD
jgi:hypothetical protein